MESWRSSSVGQQLADKALEPSRQLGVLMCHRDARLNAPIGLTTPWPECSMDRFAEPSPDDIESEPEPAEPVHLTVNGFDSGALMKPRLIIALLMFLSSYFPLVIIFAIKDLDVSSALPSHPRTALFLLVIEAVACLVDVLAVRSIKTGVETELTKVSNKSADMFSYTIPYMISFYNFTLGDWKTLACLTIFMSIMFLLTYKTNTFLANPVLALAGYGLYDCSFKSGNADWQGLALSRQVLRVGDRHKVEQVSQFLFLVIFQQRMEEEHDHQSQWRTYENKED